jgi:hypothetical protein
MQAELAEILGALELPPRALARWLDDLEEFCRAHGGEPRYRDLLGLIADCRAAQDKR